MVQPIFRGDPELAFLQVSGIDRPIPVSRKQPLTLLPRLLRKATFVPRLSCRIKARRKGGFGSSEFESRECPE